MSRWKICKERRTPAGIATESVGLILHAETAEQAVANAKQMFGHYGALVALEERN
jgi:carbohydrate-selective porin OprB